MSLEMHKAGAENLITQHLDTWTQAIETRSSAGRGSNNKLNLVGIKKLRELILEMAVRGLLVPQGPNDEPASELLKKIAAEKAQLIKEGKIKKTKALPEITEDEKPFDLQSGWEFTRLNDVGDWGAGATPRRGNSEYYGGKIPWFKSGELVDDFISETEETITEKALKECSLRLNQPGDVLIAMYGATIGKTSILNVVGTTNQAVCACTTFSEVFNQFLLLLLKAYKSRFTNMGSGGAQPNISKVKIVGTVIALPPLEEQKRIVAKVDELMALCDQLESQTLDSIETHQTLVETLLGNLVNPDNTANFQEAWSLIAQNFDVLFTTEHSIDTLKQTILQLAVMGKLVPQNPNDEPASALLKKIAAEKAQLIADKKIKKSKPLPKITEEEKPFDLPNGWEWVKLIEVISMMDAGWSPACSPESSPNNETWGVLKTTAVQILQFLPEENKVLPSSKEPRPQYEVKTGDILVTRAGPWNRVGVSCLVKNTRPRLMTSDKLIRFHLVDVGMSEEYMVLVLQAGATAEYLESCKSGMASSQVNISQDKLKAAPIPLPAKEEQKRIVAKVNELMTLCDQLKTQLQTAQQAQTHLAQSIAQEALA